MSLSDSESDRATMRPLVIAEGLASAVSAPLSSGGVFYPKARQAIIEECHHLNRFLAPCRKLPWLNQAPLAGPPPRWRRR